MRTINIITLLFLSLINVCFSENKWEIQTINLKEGFQDIQFINNDGWVVGCWNGTENPYVIEHSSDFGKNWWIQYSNSISTECLTSIQFLNKDLGWAVGTNNTIIHTTNGGEDWVKDSSGGLIDYKNIYFVDEKNGWIVGNSPDEAILYVLRTNDGGKNWTNQKLGWQCKELHKVFFIDSLNGWITGSYPALFYRTTDGGVSWESIDIKVKESIQSFHFINKYEGWACGTYYTLDNGSSGIILHTADGGINWSEQFHYNIKSLEYKFYDIQFIDKNHGWISTSYKQSIHRNKLTNIMYTQDGGKTWHEDITDIKYNLFSIYIDKELNSWTVGVNNWGHGIILFSKLDTTAITSINEKRNASSSLYDLFPNPANDFIYLRNLENDKVQIFSVIGELMKEVQLNGANEAAINVSEFPSGVFFMRCGLRTIKFTKY